MIGNCSAWQNAAALVLVELAVILVMAVAILSSLFPRTHKIAHFTDEKIETRYQLREDHPIMNQLFTAAAEAAEEAIFNSLSQADTTKGRAGRVVQQINLLKEE